jgi:hypothetical protein
MTTESIITLAGTIVTVLIAALHLGGRITAIETKVDLMMNGLINIRRHQKDDDAN